MSSNELWQPISFSQGKYLVSSLGRIKNAQEKIMKTHINRYGYCTIALHINSKPKRYLIHRLVALCFLENPFNKPQVNHKDYNRINNSVTNLEWCTNKENQRHKLKRDYTLYPKTHSTSKDSLKEIKRLYKELHALIVWHNYNGTV